MVAQFEFSAPIVTNKEKFKLTRYLVRRLERLGHKVTLESVEDVLMAEPVGARSP